MKSRSNILLMTKDDTVANEVKAALDENQSMALTGVYQELTELLRINSAMTTSQALMVDVDPDPARILQDLGTAVSMYPETRAVVVSKRYDSQLILQAMQAGARNFLQKKSITCELVKVLQQLIPDSVESQTESSSVITVFSASGGCGATTVALNLANELRLASSSQVLTIDLDSCYGTVSTYLGIEGEYGIADVLARKGEIDKDLIRSSACAHRKDFHVLVSPAGLESPKTESLQNENLIDVLESCRQVYKYTIVDAPRVSASVAEKLASASDIVLVVFQLTVKDVKFARSLVTTLAESGIGPEKIMLLANRFKRRNSVVSLGDWQQMLGVNCLHRIRSDWRKAMNCINHGRPVADVAPRSGLRRDFQKLAAKIHAWGTNGNGNGNGHGNGNGNGNGNVKHTGR